MIKALTFINYLNESVTVTLKEAEPSHGLLIQKVEGLGPVTAQINDTDFVTLPGSKFNSARRTKRNIVVDFIFTGTDIETVRHFTYDMFPEEKYITVQVETDHRHGETYGYVEHNEPNIFSDKEGTQISILCQDPNFYSVKDGNQIVSFSNITPLFEFPFSNESLMDKLIEFGNIEVYKERVITYNGDVETGIMIYIHFTGPAGDITIYNLDTREHMGLKLSKIENITGAPIRAGDDIIISTLRDKPYVHLLRNGIYTNVLNILDKHSDWFQLSAGDNRFAFIAESGENNLRLRIENKVVYRGM